MKKIGSIIIVICMFFLLSGFSSRETEKLVLQDGKLALTLGKDAGGDPFCIGEFSVSRVNECDPQKKVVWEIESISGECRDVMEIRFGEVPENFKLVHEGGPLKENEIYRVLYKIRNGYIDNYLMVKDKRLYKGIEVLKNYHGSCETFCFSRFITATQYLNKNGEWSSIKYEESPFHFGGIYLPITCESTWTEDYIHPLVASLGLTPESLKKAVCQSMVEAKYDHTDVVVNALPFSEDNGKAWDIQKDGNTSTRSFWVDCYCSSRDPQMVLDSIQNTDNPFLNTD